MEGMSAMLSIVCSKTARGCEVRCRRNRRGCLRDEAGSAGSDRGRRARAADREAKVKVKAKAKDEARAKGKAKVKVEVKTGQMTDGGRRETGEERKAKGKSQKPGVKTGDGRRQKAELPDSSSTSTFASTCSGSSTSTSTLTFPRIYLSPPHMSGRELDLVRQAFESNWIAPLGSQVDAFEHEFAEMVGVPYATALSSGTAALHLALRILAPSSSTLASASTCSREVLCSTFTFSASANAITYEGFVPVFIDCDARSWNMDPGLLREELAACAKRGKLPRAVIVVDLYGQSADYDQIQAACAEYGVPLIEDAAEALGATYQGKAKAKVEVEAEGMGGGRWGEVRNQKLEARSQSAEGWGRKTDARSASQRARGKRQKLEQPISTLTSTSTSARLAGSFGAAAAFSFNGNKIITTSGGGMLVSHDKAIVDKARFLATQARDKAPYYQHSEIGFNYRMSNILAAIGRGQLTVLPERIAARRRNFEFYQRALGDLPGVEFMPEAPYGRCTRWLTCLTLGKAKVEAKVKAKARAPVSTSTVGEAKVKVKVEQDGRRETGRTGPRSSVLRLLQAMEKENIEARPLWKPMHLQPVFKGCRVRGGGVSERLFENGLCLPSGSALTEEELSRICGLVRRHLRA